MFSAVIAALLIVVTLLVSAFLLFQRRRCRLALVQKARATTTPLAVAEYEPSHPFPSPGRYGQRRILLSLGLLAMLMAAFLLHDSLAGGALKTLGDTLGLGVSFRAQPTDLKPPAHPAPLTASVRLVRVDSTDRRQYATSYEYNVWAYSSCSGIAMEMVMNAYGRHLIATDVLQEEYNLGVWNVQLGLLREEGIAQTAAYFGFTTRSGHDLTLDDIIAVSNKGAPVIVSVRNSYYYPGGHLFVIRGGDSQYVYIADSSIQNFTRMARPMFLGMWQGFYAVLTPKS